jgi:hypothetical protein
MRRRKAGAALVAFLLCTGNAGAETLHDGQLWLTTMASGPVGLPGHDRLLGWIDVQTRFGDDIGRLSQALVRPGVGWRINPSLDLWIGYARIDTLREGADDVGENRMWQQASFAIATLFDGALTGRTRLEQRWVEGGSDVGWRVRQLIRYGRRFEGTRWSLVVFDEVFFAFNDTDWGADAGFDQNRMFAGVAFHFSQLVRVEVGYLNQFVAREGAPDSANHALSLSLFAMR